MRKKIMISKPIWVDDLKHSEEGGYYQALTRIEGKEIELEVWTKKPDNPNRGDLYQLRQLSSEDGNDYWCIPIGLLPFWPDGF
jgi:hypothetical protein